MGPLASKFRRKKVSRSTSVKNIVKTAQTFQLSFNAPDWAEVHEESFEKWRRDHQNFGFAPMKMCPKRMSEECCWNSVNCYSVDNNKDTATLSSVCHDDETRTFNYSSKDIIKEFLLHADTVNIVPTSSDFVPICFKLNNMQDESMKFMYILAADPTDNIFFFLDKQGQYNVCQLEISLDDSRIILLVGKNTTRSEFEVQYIVHTYERRPQAYGKDFQGNMFDLGHEFPGFYAWNNQPKLIFDCRYFSSRILIVNVKRIQTKDMSNYIAAYNCTKRSLLFAQKDGIFTGAEQCNLWNAVMSPDGLYVIAVIVCKSGNKEIGLKPGKSLVFFDPDKLTAIITLHIGVDNVYYCYLADVPSFSKSGRKLAVRLKKSVKIIQLPFPPTLQSLCRSVFLEYMPDDLMLLKIPQKIKDYLQYKPYLQ